MKGIAETGFVVAFGNANDGHHAWGLEVAKGITEPLLTCEAVLAEAAFGLGSSAYVLALGTGWSATWLSIALATCRPLTELANRYRVGRPDLADLCVYSDERALSAPHGDHRR